MTKYIVQKSTFFFYCFSLLLAFNCFISSCASLKKSFNPAKVYNKEKLQHDYTLFRQILEDVHPSLYWYTTKDSLDFFFNEGYNHITDSMTERQFRTLLSYVISKINCGHTYVRYSKKYNRYMDTARLPQFPLSIKFWDDNAIVYNNINRRDSLLTRGALIKSINNKPIKQIRDSLFGYLVTDGYSANHKYQTLSNPGTFGALYQSVFGDTNAFAINYIDSAGIERNSTVNLYNVKKDTSFPRFLQSLKKITRKQRKLNRLFNARNILIDTAGSTAYITITSFSNGNKLKPFFKKSFKVLNKRSIQHIVIDVRANGGGNVNFSTKLTQYIADHKFKLADSLYATKRLSKYEKYIGNTATGFFFMNFATTKKQDGNYHFRYFERYYYQPKKKYHFNGKVYIITGGNSFSATTMFANALKGQKNVTIVGEETGGGAYGNTAWFIPEVTLPITHIRFALPRFRMVMNNTFAKNGRGIFPDVEVKPTIDALKKGYDVKKECVKKLITADKNK